MQIIDGKLLSAELLQSLTEQVDIFNQQTGITPCLHIVSVGTDPASQSYIRSKVKAGNKVGVNCVVDTFLESIQTQDLVDYVESLNKDDSVHGVIIQLPLPQHIDASRVLNTLSPKKDVDGFTFENQGKLLSGKPLFVPCTPLGVMYALERYKIETDGVFAVVVGRSDIVGKPMAALLTQANATVTLCHSHTKHLEKITRQADIVVSAVGKPNIIHAFMIKNHSTIIDVGINRVPDPKSDKGCKIVGDANYQSVSARAAYLTPVPGGVGLLTVAMLLKNTLKAAQLFKDEKLGAAAI